MNPRIVAAIVAAASLSARAQPFPIWTLRPEAVKSWRTGGPLAFDAARERLWVADAEGGVVLDLNAKRLANPPAQLLETTGLQTQIVLDLHGEPDNLDAGGGDREEARRRARLRHREARW